MTSNSQAKSTASPFMLLHNISWQRLLGAALGLLTILLLFRHRALSQIGEAYIGDTQGDAGLYIWLVKSNIRDFLSLPWFNTRAFYPYTQSLAWSDNFILPSAIAAPFLMLGAPFVVVYNLLLLAANFLNGLCTFHLCAKLTGKIGVSFIAAMAFMTWPFFGAHMGHPQLQFAFFLPLFILLVFRFLAKPDLLAAFSTGICITAAFLTTVYYAIFCIFILVTLLLGLVVVRPKYFNRKLTLQAGAGLIAGIVPVIPFALPYFNTQSAFGDRFLHEPYYFAASILSYFAASPYSLLYGKTAALSHAEALLFPGCLILCAGLYALTHLWQARQLRSLARIFILLMLVAALSTCPILNSPFYRYLAALSLWAAMLVLFWLLYRMAKLEEKLGFSILTNRSVMSLFLLLAAIGFAVTLGPLGNTDKGEIAFGIHRLFYEIMPGFSALRAIGRLGVVVMLALCVLSAFCLSLLQDRKHLPGWGLVVIGLGICVESYAPVFPINRAPLSPVTFEYLQQLTSRNDAVIALPLTSELDSTGRVKSWGNFATLNVNYMNWVFPSEFNLVNGYSGIRTRIMHDFPSQMSNFPDQRSLKELNSISGLRYVIYASQFAKSFDKEAFFKRVQLYSSQLRYITGDEDGTFLFSLEGETRLREDTFLLVSAYPAGTLYLDLMSLYSKDAPDITVEILQRDYFGENPVASATIKPTGEWETFAIPIPQTPERIRPLKLYFRTASQSTIFFRNSRFEPIVFGKN